MKQFCFVVVLIHLIGANLVLAAQSPVGKWKTLDEKSGNISGEVEIYEQSGKLFGRIVAMPEPNDNQGNPKTCIACTGVDKGKPILGLVILRDFIPHGDRYKGSITNPNDGKVYTAEIWVEGGKLRLRGYFGFFYQTRTWLKA
jgi:uncharacterized protein (DUF2147 family)